MKNNKFYPSINGIYFKNFDMVEDFNSIKHIRGDLYITSPDNPNGECVGYYNPVYQTEEGKPSQYFLRLEDSYQFLYETEGRYESIFNKKAVPFTEYDCPVGLQELIADLEIITYLYEFMSGIRPNCDFESIGMVGIINGTAERPIIKVIQIKDKNIQSDSQIMEFITTKVESIQLNPEYLVRFFKCCEDFTINQSNGKIINVYEG